MTDTEQLKALLKNAVNNGFTVDDIALLAEEAETEIEEADAKEEYIDDLQAEAADMLADFLCSIDYYNGKKDVDQIADEIYAALNEIRLGNWSIKISNRSIDTSPKDQTKDEDYMKDVMLIRDLINIFR